MNKDSGCTLSLKRSRMPPPYMKMYPALTPRRDPGNATQDHVGLYISSTKPFSIMTLSISKKKVEGIFIEPNCTAQAGDHTSFRSPWYPRAYLVSVQPFWLMLGMPSLLNPCSLHCHISRRKTAPTCKTKRNGPIKRQWYNMKRQD